MGLELPVTNCTTCGCDCASEGHSNALAPCLYDADIEKWVCACGELVAEHLS